MKTITLHSVKCAALLLLEANTETSTLDIKNLLRHLDYEANQSDVSTLLLQAADELPLDKTPNGIFTVYSLPTPPQVLSDDDDDDTIITRLCYCKQNGDLVNGQETDDGYTAEDWLVTCTVDDTKMWFSRDYSRDEVRQAYASLKRVSFFKTRASRI